MNLTWLKGLIDQLVAFLLRPRHLGIKLLTVSSALLIALSGGFALELKGFAGLFDTLKFSSGDGLPGHLVALVAYIACSTWLTGLAMVVMSYRREWHEADAQRVLVVELRGLVDTSDRPLLEAVPRTVFDVLCMVVGILVSLGSHMRQLSCHPGTRISEFIQSGRDGGSDTVSGQQPVKPKCLETLIQGAFTDRPPKIAAMWQQVALSWAHRIPQLADDRHRLCGQGHQVRRDVLGAKAFLVDLGLQLLHMYRWDGPEPLGQIKLVLRCQPQLASPNTCPCGRSAGSARACFGARLQEEAAVRKPLIEDALEQPICSQALDQDLLLSALERVDSLCNQGAGGFASTARLFQADLRVLAQRDAFLFT